MALDRQVTARAQVAAEGLTVLGQGDTPKTHPAVVIERDQSILMLRALRALGLDDDRPVEHSPGHGF